MKNFYIILTVIFQEEKDCWTAECRELGTASFGDTFEEARDNITDAIELHLDELEAVGECGRFLKENNIKKNNPNWFFFYLLIKSPSIFTKTV